MKKLALLFGIALTIIFYSCKEGITDPIEPEAGRRDYVWTLDSLENSSSFSVSSMWGVSENDLWIGGYMGAYPGEELQHFDGHKFERNNQYIPNIFTIWGLNENKIYVGSELGIIYQYNGTTWKEEFSFPHENNIDFRFLDIFGTAKYNIYAVGYMLDYRTLKPNQFKIFGFIYKYDGLKWVRLILEETKSNIKKLIEYSDRLYISRNTYKMNGLQNNTVCEYKDGKFFEIISDTTNSYDCNINLINNELLVNKENDIYLMKNGVLKQFINLDNYGINFNETRFMGNIWGRNRNDLFFQMGGGIMHYNGSDLQYIYKFSNRFTMPYGSLIFKDVIVFLIQDNINQKIYLLRGKLKE